VLRDSHLEALAEINSSAPGMLDPDGVERPGVERLRDILTEQEPRFSKELKAPEKASSERADFEETGEHVAGEFTARGIHAPEVSRRGGTQVGVDLVMGRGEVKLRVAIQRVAGKEHAVGRLGWLRERLLRSCRTT
jgi:hypothetical protein